MPNFPWQCGQALLKSLIFTTIRKKIYETAKKHGVEFTSFHAPFSPEISLSHPDESQRKEAVETIKKAITSAAKIDIKIMVLHPSGSHYENYPDRESW